jgi:quinol monooxygenase YgiN
VVWTTVHSEGVREPRHWWHVNGDRATLITQEAFDDKAAYDAHMSSVAVEIFRAGVDPLTLGEARVMVLGSEHNYLRKL